MSDVLLECIDLIKIYEAESKIKVPALRGIDLSILESQLLAFIGSSGAGKSTLIRILGMIEVPSSGDVVYNGSQGQLKFSKASFSDRLWFRREVCGYLFQLPEQNLLYNINAVKNVLLPMQIVSRLSHGEQKKRAYNLLKLLGLGKKRNYLPSRLSGGEAQRLGICVALANDPPLILADEPTGELDSRNTLEIIQYFRDLNRNLGKTFIVVTHNRRFAKMTDMIYRIHNGKLISTDISQKSTLKSTEVFLPVSDIGEITIPSDLLKKHNFNQIVRISIAKKYLEISPHNTNSRLSPVDSKKKEEFTGISEAGTLVIPASIRKQIGMGSEVKIISAYNSIKVMLDPEVQE